MNPVKTLALAGNPNCGKTTLFNALTGDCHRVGNWPGVTVERAEGAYRHEGEDVWVVDLPGLYSLDAHTPDERVTRDYLAGGGADVVVNVIDASNLERSLYLTAQLLELEAPLIVVLNMMDLAGSLRIRIRTEQLEQALGCPVIAMTAMRNQGVEALRAAAARIAPGRTAAPRRTEEERYAFVRAVAKEALDRAEARLHRFSDTLDRVLLSRFAGMPLFFAVMALVFLVTVAGSRPLIGWIDAAGGRLLVEAPRLFLEQAGWPEWGIVLLADGIGAGLRAVATFVPPIFSIFVCLAVLENSGYMARGAFVMDRLMRLIGLPGRAFLPLLVGFGCNVPALFATRTLRERRERLITLLISPFMSCSARLPVYTLFAVAFFPDAGGRVVFALYLAGLLAAVLTGLLLQHTLLRGTPSAFVMELPPYQAPRPGAVLRHAGENLKGFLVRGGKVIVLAVTALSLLNGLGRAEGKGSWLERAGRAVTPLFAPMGITAANWPATVGLATGVIAKESVVGTLDALYSQMAPPAVTGATPSAALGGAPYAESGVRPGVLAAMRRHFGSGAAAFAYLLFVLLYVPCVATLAALRREAGWGWTWFSLVYQTGVAWLAAVGFYQAATWAAHPAASRAWLTGLAAVALALVAGLRLAGRRR